MFETIKVSLLTMMLTAWSALAMAQTAPSTPPGTPPGDTGGGTASPVAPEAAGDGETMTWLWVVLAVAVIAGLLYYFLGRGRATRI